MERLQPETPAWADYRAWQIWQAEKREDCGRSAAWALVEDTFGELILERIV